MTIALALVLVALVCFAFATFRREPVWASLVPAGLFLWLLSTIIGGVHLNALAGYRLTASVYGVAAPAVAPFATIPIDAATLAALVLGALSPLLLKLVPLKDNAMILFTWSFTFVVALGAVLVVDQLQNIAFSTARLLIDVGAAYAIQAALFTAARHNAPALVTDTAAVPASGIKPPPPA